MKLINLILSLTIAIVLLSSCKKESMVDDLNFLVGEWQFQNSYDFQTSSYSYIPAHDLTITSNGIFKIKYSGKFKNTRGRITKITAGTNYKVEFEIDWGYEYLSGEYSVAGGDVSFSLTDVGAGLPIIINYIKS
jgi:hypothetical protein